MLRVSRSSLQQAQNNPRQSLGFFQHPLVDTHTRWVVKTWKEEHLKVFHVTWDKEIHSYPWNQNIWFMYSLKFKKEKTFIVSPRVLNVKITFCKMQVLHENVDWIKRKIPNLEKNNNQSIHWLLYFSVSNVRMCVCASLYKYL